MSLRESFSRNIYWPLVQKIKCEYAAGALNELAESQWKNQDELISRQWQLVRRIAIKAAKEVPYYRKSFNNIGWDYKNQKFSYDDFRRIPIVEKEDLRENLSEFLNPTYEGRITLGQTSGSTGQSLSLKYSGEHESYSEAARWRAKDWWGIRPGSPQVSFWGRPYTGSGDRISQGLKSYLMNTQLISAFDLKEEKLQQIWKKIEHFKPSIIYGYPSSISTLAGFVKANHLAGDQLGIRVAMITAESSTFLQRDLIEGVFGCKTANEYGCSETGGFVYECPNGSWHISSELTFLEFLDTDGTPVTMGEPGSIVVTHLRNNYMPLIRYRVGDIGSPLSGTCNCGRGLPLMKVSVAKERDFIRLSNGECQTSEIFVYITKAVLKKFPSSILQFKAVQKTIDLLELDIVCGNNSFDGAAKLLRQLLERQLGKSIRIEIRKTPQIIREPSGKLRYFISEVNKNN